VGNTSGDRVRRKVQSALTRLLGSTFNTVCSVVVFAGLLRHADDTTPSLEIQVPLGAREHSNYSSIINVNVTRKGDECTATVEAEMERVVRTVSR
jgi:hypothetical protein